jgi:hypothetical protein
VNNEPDFPSARQKFVDRIDRFAAGGPQECTNDPDTFFGSMSFTEWATLAY